MWINVKTEEDLEEKLTYILSVLEPEVVPIVAGPAWPFLLSFSHITTVIVTYQQFIAPASQITEFRSWPSKIFPCHPLLHLIIFHLFELPPKSSTYLCSEGLGLVMLDAHGSENWSDTTAVFVTKQKKLELIGWRSTSKDTGAGAWTQRRKTNDGKEDCDWKDRKSIRT